MPQRASKNSANNPPTIEVDSFEHVPATPDSALLRLAGRYLDKPGPSVLGASLLVDDGAETARHNALIDPESDLDPAEWLWRVAFSLPAALLRDPRTSFAIEAAPGLVLDLPWPTQLEAPEVRPRPELPAPVVRRRGRQPAKAAAALALLFAIAFAPPGLPAAAKTDVLQVQRADGTVMFITRNVPRLLRLTDQQLRAQASNMAGGPVRGVSVVQAAADAVPPPETPNPVQPAEQSTSNDVVEVPATPAPAPSPAPAQTADTSGNDRKQEQSAPAEEQQSDSPESHFGERQEHRQGRRHRKPRRHSSGGGGTRAHSHGHSRPRSHRPGLRRRDGSPTHTNPGLMDALPGPSQGVPNFVIRKFRVPVFLLPIYQAAGIQYGVRWEVLAAINEIETDYGRNLNVSSAGALGWMQFMPSTWKMYGTDGNKDGRRDPYNPVDAIFAAARYLKAAGAEKDLRRAIFAYNHADWYVDSVMMRARLIAGVPSDVVGSLTGLTEGRFPVAARARYADDVAEQEGHRGLGGRRATRLVESDDGRREIDIFAREGSPAVAVNDSVVKRIGRNKKLGNYIVLQDVYGNQYTYAGLDSIARLYPVPKSDNEPSSTDDRILAANDPHPTSAASAGRNDADDDSTGGERRQSGRVSIKRRLFAHPERPNAAQAGGYEQVLEAQLAGDYETYSGYFANGLGLNAKNATLKRLRRGSHVVASTIIGRVGRPENDKAAHLRFSIRPAGRGAPLIDPKPILDGWKLLESTAIYRASGRNVLYDNEDGFSIGQILLLPKPLLQKRVLSDERIDVYPGGRRDIQTGQIDRRILATLAYLAESGLRPTVSCLRAGHSYYTSSGNVSEHASGNAVDISRINGIPIIGHQERGGITEQSVRRLMMLQGTMRPHQIISLLNLGQNTVAMGDHNDHIHVGFRPLFGDNKKLGQQASAVLKPGQWEDLIARLRQIRNPVVPTRPSRYALRNRHRRSSHAHRGE